jgi:flagellar biosynthesis/type III secretory pathway protein FliH
MKKHAKDDAWIEALKLRYQEIRKRLDEMCMNGRISEYVKCALIDMTKKVNTNIATKYDKIKEGVNTAMGGKVLDYEAKTILNTGIRQGREEGLEAGRLEGLEIGRQEGLEVGRQEGLEAGRLETVLELCRDGVIDISEAAHRLNMDEEELKKYL